MDEKDIFGLRELAEQTILTENLERKGYLTKVFNLRLNPFPEVGVPESEVDDVADIRPDIIKQVRDWLVDALGEQRRKILILKGQYGSGKSFLLRKIVSDVSDAFSGRGELRPKIIYVYRPSVEAQALNRSILEEIGLDNVRKMVWNIVRRELAHDLLQKPRPYTLDNLINGLFGSSKSRTSAGPGLFSISEDIPAPLARLFDLDRSDDHRKFLQEFDKLRRNRTELHSYFTDLLSRGLSNLSSVSSANAFVDLLLAYEDSEAWHSLLNMKLPRRDRAGFVRQFLQDLITLLKSDSYIYLFVAIDEFEQITDNRLLSAKEQADYAYTMMEIINQIHKGLGLIISITEEGYQKIADITPLKDRLFSQIELRPLNADEVGKLIGFYLDQAREKQDPPLIGTYPLSKEDIKYITEKIRPIGLGATPRNVVQFFHNFIEHCYNNQVTNFDRRSIDAYVEHYRQGK